MTTLALFHFLLLAVCLSVCLGAETRGTVTDEALESALKDKRYLTRQLKCALGEGACDPVGRRLKTYAPLVLRGACPKCTPTEVRQIQQVLSHIQRHYPKEWSKILKQYAGQ
uniref:Chemosensory protein n=1 Tax=Corythucha ciliata TaxID=369451 RepID=A0A2S0M1B9_CORCT|nr:chemosensory protein 2 [Corythucha ciliata]AVM86428.1 chemosensory protein [Corythucha ciliata]